VNCEKCGERTIRTLADNCVSKLKLYKTVAYYCDDCDELFVIDKYKDVIDKHKYDGELPWLREQNPKIKK